MINIGDRVSFIWEQHEYIGTLLSSQDTAYNRVLFDSPHKNWSLNRDNSIDLYKDRYPITSYGPQRTTEEKVAIRCKLLWNKSKWVKSHPQMAY